MNFYDEKLLKTFFPWGQYFLSVAIGGLKYFNIIVTLPLILINIILSHTYTKNINYYSRLLKMNIYLYTSFIFYSSTIIVYIIIIMLYHYLRY